MILHGRNLIIKAGGVAIAAAKSCSVKVQAKTIETSSADDGEWDHSKPGRKSWSVSVGTLVTSIASNVKMVGTTISLDVQLSGGMGKAFSGFVNNPELTAGTYTGTGGNVYWDKTRKKFILRIAPAQGVVIYYAAWSNSSAYTSPSAYDLFSYNGVTYTWLSNELTAEKLTGNAHVKTWNGSGSVGNLLNGSFEFEGTGALTPASLPTT